MDWTLHITVVILWAISIYGAYIIGKSIGNIEGIAEGAEMVHKGRKKNN